MFNFMQNRFFPMISMRDLEIIDFTLKHLYEEAIFIYTESLPLLEKLSLEDGKRLWLEIRRFDYSFERITSLCPLIRAPLLMLEDKFDPKGKYKYDSNSPILSLREELQIIPNPYLKQKLFSDKFGQLKIENLQEIDYSLDDVWESVTAIYGSLLSKLQDVQLFENRVCSLLILELVRHLEHIETHCELSREPLAELTECLEPEEQRSVR